MALRSAFVLAIFSVLVGCAPPSPTSIEVSETLGLLPVPGADESWTTVDGPTAYSEDGLFEYLNGGAPLYLKYGFEELAHVRYQLGEDEFACITIDVFRMDSDLGAFGLYSSIRPPAVSPRQWGSEGYRSGPVAAAWRGPVFVHGEADDERQELIDGLERTVAAIVDSLSDEIKRPAILEPLPAFGLVPYSERYVAEDFLGHAFLPGGVVASYEVDGQTAELFFSDLGAAEMADEALASLRAHVVQWGEVVSEVSGPGSGGFRFIDPGLGSGISVAVGQNLTGIYGDLSVEQQERLLNSLAENLEGPG